MAVINVFFLHQQMQSESENGNVSISVVVGDKEQSRIDYGFVKKLKQVDKLRAARIVARAKSEACCT